MPHGHNIYKTAADMGIATMCNFPPDQRDLPHWKCVLCCCSTCRSIVTPNHGLHDNTQTMCPTIHFHVYKVVSCCTVNVRRKF